MVWIKIKLLQKTLWHYSKRLTFVQERLGTHACDSALHLTFHAYAEISDGDNEVAVSKSEQQKATDDTHALFQMQNMDVENVQQHNRSSF